MTDPKDPKEIKKDDEQQLKIGDLEPEKDPSGGKRHPKYPSD
jgi:hypothetical protein